MGTTNMTKLVVLVMVLVLISSLSAFARVAPKKQTSKPITITISGKITNPQMSIYMQGKYYLKTSNNQIFALKSKSDLGNFTDKDVVVKGQVSKRAVEGIRSINVKSVNYLPVSAL